MEIEKEIPKETVKRKKKNLKLINLESRIWKIEI